MILVLVVAAVAVLPSRDAEAAPLFEQRKLTASDAYAGESFRTRVSLRCAILDALDGS